MKGFLLVVSTVLLCLVIDSATSQQTDPPPFNNVECLKKIEFKMNNLLNRQIEAELVAHYKYLGLAYTFNGYEKYFPKVSKYFQDKANEEVEHAQRFIKYQNDRGGHFEFKKIEPNNVGSTDVTSAFKTAQQLEISVTKKLTDLVKSASSLQLTTTENTATDNLSTLNVLSKGQPVIVTLNGAEQTLEDYIAAGDDNSCVAKFNYVELTEMISHEFLGHQIEDTKELANYYQTLNNFNNDALGSYMFDKNL